jgi:hypothetical protein
MIRSYLLIAAKLGGWTKDAGADGAAYVSPAQNPNREKGGVCRNCAFWNGSDGCAIVKGPIAAEGLCKLWVIDESRLGAGRVDGRLAGRPMSLEVVPPKRR